MNRGAIQTPNNNGTMSAAAAPAASGFLGGLDFQSAIALAVMVSAFMRR